MQSVPPPTRKPMSKGTKTALTVLWLIVGATFALALILAKRYGTFVFLTLLVVGIVLLVRRSNKQAKIKAQKQAELEEQLRIQEEKTRLEREEARREYVKGLVDLHGEEIANRIIERRPVIGDSKEIIRAMLGTPLDTDIKQTKEKTIDTWKYQQVAKNRYGVIFKFENGSLIEWEDKR